MLLKGQTRVESILTPFCHAFESLGGNHFDPSLYHAFGRPQGEGQDHLDLLVPCLWMVRRGWDHLGPPLPCLWKAMIGVEIILTLLLCHAFRRRRKGLRWSWPSSCPFCHAFWSPKRGGLDTMYLTLAMGRSGERSGRGVKMKSSTLLPCIWKIVRERSRWNQPPFCNAFWREKRGVKMISHPFLPTSCSFGENEGEMILTSFPLLCMLLFGNRRVETQVEIISTPPFPLRIMLLLDLLLDPSSTLKCWYWGSQDDLYPPLFIS